MTTLASPAASAGLLAAKAAATAARIRALEPDAHHRNSFVPYTPVKGTPYVELDGQRLLMMSGYGYLGLHGDPRVEAAAVRAVERFGTGSPGVRALAGSVPLHEELERAVARYAEREAAVVFSSGYAANIGVVGAVCGPGDAVFVDKLDHASIVDGCKLSGADVVRFRHNDPGHLEERLLASRCTGVRLVVVDSVYSMDGDVAPLAELREVCDRHGALLMVDEAHALGTIGATGGGIEEHSGVRADVKVGTLSKAVPATGGWAAGDAELVRHLRYGARPFLFSAALAPAQAGAALESLEVLRAEPWRVQHVQRESQRFRERLHAGGIGTAGSETAVVPLVVGTDEQAYAVATRARELGVVGLPVVTPAVPAGTARLRIAVTAAHSRDQLDHAADVFVRVAGELGLRGAAGGR
ncbi:aminotransferase class I/II-fold pyridoxal phosphate-dependent enzyme [Paenibacillus sp. TRM 82003]|uniref:aminotransferase class I/II-fold pyridoxal phosphate-dependent enzyme n=1 Tax=Kineococcus sp. TRM81007 TaxID=2925831 RepID=UPI001F56EF5F|nr:aminotransferase class I/II-fold pyridoxal phosphate-dependent enzyme [Kineococcus sp. TRM81007]MCI2237325.1 aminotransferase class I/II-fold pyridoxal phosphate-dependent enzyme [Kineococcus sp. TRM81007]MCI3926568.1 aminotransferase class I/II-fold pyridoxal phosphate-dependent enzyme [Paenibacillus sp. TRM 82003]